MTSIELSEASVLIIDPLVYSRRLLREALIMAGFSKIGEVKRFDVVEQALERVEPDLIVVNIDEDRAAVCGAIRRIRDGVFGSNPFVTVIALTNTPDEEAVAAALAAGTDDMVTKPISPQILMDRVTNLINNRKGFVATRNYLGPDRHMRFWQTSAEDQPTVDVPNSLRQAALDDELELVDAEQIAETMQSLCKQKIDRLAAEISKAALEIKKQHEVKPGQPVSKKALVLMTELLCQIELLALRQSFTNIGSIAKNTLQILKIIDKSRAKPDVRQFDVLHLHAQAMMAALKDSDGSAGEVASALNQVKLAASA